MEHISKFDCCSGSWKSVKLIAGHVPLVHFVNCCRRCASQVDGSSVVDDDDLLVITSDSDNDACSHTPARNTSNVTARDEIPDVWDGFDEGFAAACDPFVSPLHVSDVMSIH